jgi:hypothetical protein
MRKTLQNGSHEMKMLIEVHNRHFADPAATVGPWIRELMDLGFRPKAMALPSTKRGILRNLRSDDFPELLCSFREHCPHVLLVKNEQPAA